MLRAAGEMLFTLCEFWSAERPLPLEHQLADPCALSVQLLRTRPLMHDALSTLAAGTEPYASDPGERWWVVKKMEIAATRLEADGREALAGLHCTEKRAWSTSGHWPICYQVCYFWTRWWDLNYNRKPKDFFARNICTTDRRTEKQTTSGDTC